MNFWNARFYGHARDTLETIDVVRGDNNNNDTEVRVENTRLRSAQITTQLVARLDVHTE